MSDQGGDGDLKNDTDAVACYIHEAEIRCSGDVVDPGEDYCVSSAWIKLNTSDAPHTWAKWSSYLANQLLQKKVNDQLTTLDLENANDWLEYVLTDKVRTSQYPQR